MAGHSREDAARLAAVKKLVDTTFSELVSKVIGMVKAFPEDARGSGDDSVLADVWEEFKYQMQREEFSSFGAYEESIQGVCDGLVDELDRSQQALPRLWIPASFSWDEEEDLPHGDPISDALKGELYLRVCNIANDEELAIDPDEERDQERMADDIRYNLGNDDADVDPERV